MADENVGQHLEIGSRISRPRRVRGRVEDEPLRLRRGRLFERFRLQLVAVFERRLDEHRLAAAEQHDICIGHPARRRNDDLVTGIERRQQRIIEHLLAAGSDRNLAWFVVKAVVALELRDDRRLEFRDAVDIGIFCLALVERALGGVLDVLRRIEVRLARGKRNDVPPLRLELTRFRRDGDGRGRLDAVQTVGDEAHD